MTQVGYLYVLANSSMPGLVKVGKTTRSPTERATELSGATGLATPFIVVYDQLFENCDSAENFVHAFLQEKGYRVSENREFFNAPVNIIVRAFELAPGIIRDISSVKNQHQPEDELIKFSQNDELDDLSIDKISENTEPWRSIFEEAEAHYYGFEDYIEDHAESLRLYRQAASLGSTEAYVRIGLQYQEGEGVARNLTKALEFFKEGARKGRPACYFLMGLLFSSENQDANADKCFSLFIKNISSTPLRPDFFSTSEARSVYHGCLRVIAIRQMPGNEGRHQIIDQIIPTFREAILDTCKRMQSYSLKQGNNSIWKDYLSAEEYILNL